LGFFAFSQRLKWNYEALRTAARAKRTGDASS
jgi:hypothetical protein